MDNITGQKSLELMIPSHPTSEEGQELWQNGLDMSQKDSELLSSFSEQSVEQSAEESQAVIYSLEYDMGDMGGYSTGTLGTLALYGVCAGFGLAIGVALLAYAISCVMSAFRGITTE